MPAYVALVRAVNVGGTGALTSAELKAVCEAAGLAAVRTYIASGNVVFRSSRGEVSLRRDLAHRLTAHTGRATTVVIRSASEMAGVLAQNPFPTAAANLVHAVFLDDPVTSTTLEGIAGKAEDEAIVPGQREIYIHYGSGAGRSKLRIPAAKLGTARNMKTVAKLAELAAGLGK